MKITKYLHSCLLVEEQEKMVLIDPGNYSYESNALDINKLSSLDAIAVTHEHQDHMHVPWIKEILKKFPTIPIYTTLSAKNLLEKEGIQNIFTVGSDFIKLESVPHEEVLGPSQENIMVTLFNKLSHPGDSLSFKNSADILALPIQAPWGSLVWALETAVKVKPKIVLPIHDFHWKDEFRKVFYKWSENYLSQNNIVFKALETGEMVEI